MTDIQVSFCATNLDTAGTLESSLASIEVLGTATGRSFETVVADGPSAASAREILSRWEAGGPHRRVVRHGQRNRGLGRRLAFEASLGSWIVPFDTSIVYPARFGSLLRSYLDLQTDRMLFSEICALSRQSIVQVGGWRDLIGAEDLDLYAPVAAKFGVIAYPVGEPTAQSKVMGQYAREMRYTRGGRFHRLFRMFLIQRDKVIGANYHVSDLMAFNTAKPLGFRFAVRLWFAGAIVGAAFSPIPRRSVGSVNNYLYLRNQVIESMLRGDYRAMLGAGSTPPRLPLTGDEMRYLALRSEPWQRAQRQAPELFVPKVSRPPAP